MTTYRAYRTFLRTANNWSAFSKSEKILQETGLTLAEARDRCADFNNSRTPDEIDSGTKMEFEEE